MQQLLFVDEDKQQKPTDSYVELGFDDFFNSMPDNQPTEVALLNQQNNTPVVNSHIDEKKNLYIYGSNWIVLQNRLLHAITNLTLNERRLILFLSPMVREDVEQRPDAYKRIFTVHALDFADHYNIDKKNVYRILAEAADGILTKAFWFWDFNSNHKKAYRTGSSWADYCVYKRTEGRIEISLSTFVVEMLTVFDRHNPFTKYKKEWISCLNLYSIDLFEIVISANYKKEKEVIYSISYLREKFGCVNKYPDFKDFRRYIIQPAIEQVKQYTPYEVGFELIKNSRTVEQIKFIFSNKEHVANKNRNQTATNITQLTNNPTVVSNKKQFKDVRIVLPEAIQEEIIQLYQNQQQMIDYSVKAANTYIDNLSKQNKPVNNPQGIYINALRENWGLNLLEEEKERLKKAEQQRLKRQQKQAEKQAKEQQHHEFEIRFAKAKEVFISLPESIQEITLDALQNSLPKHLLDKFIVNRNLCKKTKSQPFLQKEFQEYFLKIMDGNY